MVNPFSPTELTQELAKLTNWKTDEHQKTIRRSFKFKNFKQAWRFMSQIAFLAEEINHHPDWRNVYNTVDITLTTHDAGCLTHLDITMAQEIENFLKDLER